MISLNKISLNSDQFLIQKTSQWHNSSFKVYKNHIKTQFSRKPDKNLIRYKNFVVKNDKKIIKDGSCNQVPSNNLPQPQKIKKKDKIFFNRANLLPKIKTNVSIASPILITAFSSCFDQYSGIYQPESSYFSFPKKGTDCIKHLKRKEKKELRTKSSTTTLF